MVPTPGAAEPSHIGPVNSVCFTSSSSSQVLSCGHDSKVVSIQVDGSLMEAFARVLVQLVDDSSCDGAASSAVRTPPFSSDSRMRAGSGRGDPASQPASPDAVEVLKWHLDKGILQVGPLALQLCMLAT